MIIVVCQVSRSVILLRQQGKPMTQGKCAYEVRHVHVRSFGVTWSWCDVELRGVEPLASCLPDRRSTELSYSPYGLLGSRGVALRTAGAVPAVVTTLRTDPRQHASQHFHVYSSFSNSCIFFLQ